MVIYQCDQCHKRFNQKIDYTRHTKRKTPCKTTTTGPSQPIPESTTQSPSPPSTPQRPDPPINNVENFICPQEVISPEELLLLQMHNIYEMASQNWFETDTGRPLIKIGSSKDVYKRLTDYRTYNPYPIELIGYYTIFNFNCYKLDNIIKTQLVHHRAKLGGGVEFYFEFDRSVLEELFTNLNIQYKWNSVRDEREAFAKKIVPQTGHPAIPLIERKLGNATSGSGVEAVEAIKPFVCSNCAKAFARTDSLTRHLNGRCEVLRQQDHERNQLIRSLMVKLPEMEKENQILRDELSKTEEKLKKKSQELEDLFKMKSDVQKCMRIGTKYTSVKSGDTKSRVNNTTNNIDNSMTNITNNNQQILVGQLDQQININVIALS